MVTRHELAAAPGLLGFTNDIGIVDRWKVVYNTVEFMLGAY